MIAVPGDISGREKELYNELKEISRWNPRGYEA
jgi:hypothetical protein